MPSLFNESGYTTKSIDDFRSDMVNSAKVAFADKLQGRDIRADDSSVLGRLFAAVSRPLVQNEEMIPIILQAFDINSAEGQQLDNLLWNIHRVKRRGSAQATGMVILHGDLGTVIGVGSTVANSLTGDAYQTDSNVTLSNINAVGVDIEVLNVYGRYTIEYTIDGYLSESPTIIVERGEADNSLKDIAVRLVDAVNSQSSYLSATLNNDNSVKVTIINKSLIGNFSVTGEAKIIRGYMPVYVTSSTYSSRESLPLQISQIRSPVLGWRGVSNPYYTFPSQGIEDDEEYRTRGKLMQGAGYGKFTSILMALKSVKGVVYESIQQNTSKNTTNSGIINNGVAITVQGGNEDAIALAIFNSISEGIATSGDIVKTVKDINGFGHDIRFSRPKIIPLQIKMSLVTYPDFPKNGSILIKQAIVEWFNNLNVGEDIHHSRLYEPINKNRGFAIRNLKFGYKGGTLGSDDIIIRFNEIATVSAEDINIGGN